MLSLHDCCLMEAFAPREWKTTFFLVLSLLLPVVRRVQRSTKTWGLEAFAGNRRLPFFCISYCHCLMQTRELLPHLAILKERLEASYLVWPLRSDDTLPGIFYASQPCNCRSVWPLFLCVTFIKATSYRSSRIKIANTKLPSLALFTILIPRHGPGPSPP